MYVDFVFYSPYSDFTKLFLLILILDSSDIFSSPLTIDKLLRTTRATHNIK